jgi:hypothetical protein
MPSLFEKISFDWVAIIIALIALAFSIWTFFVQRKHNILSVKPVLVLRHEWSGNSRSIHVKNCGLGLAIISKIILRNNGNVIPFQTCEDIIEIADAFFHDGGFYSQGEVIDNNIIEKAVEINILTLLFHEDHDYIEARERIFNFLKNTTLTIKYKSLHEKDYEFKTDLYSFNDHTIV